MGKQKTQHVRLITKDGDTVEFQCFDKNNREAIKNTKKYGKHKWDIKTVEIYVPTK